MFLIFLINVSYSFNFLSYTLHNAERADNYYNNPNPKSNMLLIYSFRGLSDDVASYPYIQNT